MSERGCYLLVKDVYKLRIACDTLAKCFGYGCYQVGSSLTTKDYRDVDLRTILKDEEYDTFIQTDERLKFLNAVISEWIAARTGLPIDFQFQRQTQANKEFTGRRNYIGKIN